MYERPKWFISHTNVFFSTQHDETTHATLNDEEKSQSTYLTEDGQD